MPDPLEYLNPPKVDEPKQTYTETYASDILIEKLCARCRHFESSHLPLSLVGQRPEIVALYRDSFKVHPCYDLDCDCEDFTPPQVGSV